MVYASCVKPGVEVDLAEDNVEAMVSLPSSISSRGADRES